ncbi:MAG: hypothetical protein ACR2IK_25440 [Chloroflexota bacterium]
MSTFSELIQPDHRTLVFAPLGQTGGDPGAAAAYWDEVVSRISLRDAVAEHTRMSFDVLRSSFAYGLLHYEIFTLVHDQALFVLEHALRERFVAEYKNGLRFEVTGSIQAVPVESYSDVLVFLGRHRGKKMRLVMQSPTGEVMFPFTRGGLTNLLDWARKLGLLRGQRPKLVENILKDMRNDVAHAGGPHILMPSDAAATLSDLAEIINHLWGYETPGGRLYPAPIQRDTVAIGWHPTNHSVTAGLAEYFAPPESWDECSQFAIVQAVWNGAGNDVTRYDSRFETLAYPTSYLWGPGSINEAQAWLVANPPFTDTASTTGRQFVLRRRDDQLSLPMTLAVAAAQPLPEQDGHWYLIGADNPANALGHVRTLLTPGGACTKDETCRTCYAEHHAEGDFLRILAAAGASKEPQKCLPPDFFVPGLGAGVRSVVVPM